MREDGGGFTGSREPFVAVTVPVRVNETGVPQIILEAGYQHGIRLAGCSVFIVSPNLDDEEIDRLFAMADGLLITGGEDVDPARFGQGRNGARDVSADRDELEFELADRAIERHMPLLAICRGLQVLNVLRGGTLYQHLPRERPGEVEHYRKEIPDHPVHGLRVGEPRWLDGVLPEEGAGVNSAHHQGVRELGEGLRPVAWAKDGLVEAIELGPGNGYAWTVGVQWHPERLLTGGEAGRPAAAALFRRFGDEVARAARRRRERGRYAWTELAGP